MATRNYRVVSQIIERPGKKPFFNKCGVAFDNRDVVPAPHEIAGRG